MQKTLRLPETSVRILVRPTIGGLLYVYLTVFQERPVSKIVYVLTYRLDEYVELCLVAEHP